MEENQVQETGQEEQSSQEVESNEAQTLLDKYTKTEGEEAVTEESVAKDEDGEVKLYGDRFKSVDELEKGYVELRKKLGEKGLIAPDKYELSEGIEVPEDDPLLGKFSEIAKKYNLPNEAYNEIIQMKLEADGEGSINVEQELEKLGPKAAETITAIDSFYKSKLTAESYEAVQQFAVTAENVKALDELRKSFQTTNPPSEPAKKRSLASKEEADSLLQEANALYKSGKLDESAVLRKKADAIYQELYPE